MGTGFYGSNDPTNSVKALKEQPILVMLLVTMKHVKCTEIAPYSTEGADSSPHPSSWITKGKD